MLQFKCFITPARVYMGTVDAVRNSEQPVAVSTRTRRTIIRPATPHSIISRHARCYTITLKGKQS